MQRTTLLSSALLSLTGMIACSAEVQTSRGPMKSVPKGITTTVRTNKDVEVLVHKDSASAKRKAQVRIDHSKLSAGRTIAIESTYHTDPSDIAAQFGVGKASQIQKTDVAVVIKSNMDKNLKNPMTISLDLPRATGLGLIWNSRHFYVVYTVRDSSQNTWKRGIMPDSELTINGSRVEFQSQLLGRYEVFATAEPVKVKTAPVAVEKPDFKKPPLAITKVLPLVAYVGKPVTIEGKYLSKNTRVFIGNKSVPADFDANGSLKIIMPGRDFGLATLLLEEQGSQAETKIVVKNSESQPPYIDATADQVCIGTHFIDSQGHNRYGLKRCGFAPCSREGQQDCLANADYPALSDSDIPTDKMLGTLTIRGKKGTMQVPASSKACTTMGQVGCIIKGEFMSLESIAVNPDRLRRGFKIPAAVFGGTVDMVGTYPSANNPLKGHTGNTQNLDPAQFSEAITAAAGTRFQYWDKNGTAHVFTSEGSLTPAVIVPEVVIHKVKGKWPDGTKSPCTDTAQGSCLATGDFVASAATQLNAKNIKKDVKVGSITGVFPSESSPLRTPANAAKDLTATSFNSAISSGDAFRYYNSSGMVRVTRGRAELRPGNIKAGVTIFGHTGTAGGFSTARFKAENIREGVKFAGVVGTLRMGCRSQAEKDKFNYHGTVGDPDLDIYDTIQDGLLPSQNPWTGKSQYRCGAENWEDLTVNTDGTKGCKTLSEKCMFKEKHSGSYWTGFNTSAETYAVASNRCLRLPKKDGMAWLAPSIHQLMTAYAYGLNFVGGADFKFFKQNLLWSRTAKHNAANSDTAPLRVMDPKTGVMYERSRTARDVWALCATVQTDKKVGE